MARHQLLARRVRVGRGADQADHLVDIGDRDGEAAQDVGALARLVEQELGAPADDLLAELDKGADQVLEVEHLRTAAVERHHVGAERGLQGRVAVELVEHDVGHGVALQLDDDAHAVAVGFVAKVGDALELLVAHELGDLLDEGRLVHLIRDLGEDDGLAVLAHRLDARLGAHDDRAAPGIVGGANAGPPEDGAGGREIRPRHQGDQVVDGDRRVVDIGDAAVDHLAEIVRRDVGGHADGDAAGAVDEEIGEARREDARLLLGAVVVLLEIDRVAVDILEQRHGGLGEPHLGVAHRRRRVAVDGAEIALPVGQHDAHGEILRHAHERVVDRLVAVRVILTDDVADDARRLAVRPVGRVAALVHRIEDAPMHGLQPVAGVRQRPRHDHAHGVIEVGAPHLVGDGNGLDVAGRRRGLGAAGARVFGVGQGAESRSFSGWDRISRFKPPKPPKTALAQRLTSRKI